MKFNSITDLSNTHSFFPSENAHTPAADGMTDGFFVREKIKDQIDYDAICTPINQTQLDELVEIMLEVAMNRSPTIKIGRDAEYPTGFVQQRFEQITAMHIEKVLDGIRENTTRVWNTRAYLMAALFNSVSTIDNHYAMLVNHDFNGIALARSRRNNKSDKPNTMQLTVDENGVNIKADLDTENNARARELYSAVERGDITGMSFMFGIAI